MTGPDTPMVDGAPCGVFAWRPPSALVEALSDVLDRGSGGVIDARRRAGPVRRPPRAPRAPALLREFNDAGVLAAADVHVALRLAALGGRGRRDGRARRRARRARAAARPRLRRPRDDPRHGGGRGRRAGRPRRRCRGRDAGGWIERVAASALVAVGEDDDAPSRPLRLVGTWLYLDRYWREERQARRRPARAERRGSPPACGSTCSPTGSRGCSPAQTDSRQCLAAAAAVLRRLAVVAGGPGHRQDDDGRADRRAARRAGRGRRRRRAARRARRADRQGRRPARGGRARGGARRSTSTTPIRDAAARARQASTLHRLLGWRPGSHSRFRHDRGNRLPHDVVDRRRDLDGVALADGAAGRGGAAGRAARARRRPRPARVDRGGRGARRHRRARRPTGCSSARRRATRLAAGDRPRRSPATSRRPARRSATGSSCSTACTASAAGIAALAEAIRRGDADAVLEVLADRAGGRDLDPGRRRRPGGAGRARRPSATAPSPPRASGDRGGARRRRGASAIEALGAFRVLCAHRRGAARRGDLDGADRGLARGRGRRLRRRRPLVRRAARCS